MSNRIGIEHCEHCGAELGVGQIGLCENCQPKPWYTNFYMHCGVAWSDEWECMCNDECPVCHGEIEPYKSEDEQGGMTYHVAAGWIPEGGWPEGCTSRED